MRNVIAVYSWNSENSETMTMRTGISFPNVDKKSSAKKREAALVELPLKITVSNF